MLGKTSLLNPKLEKNKISPGGCTQNFQITKFKNISKNQNIEKFAGVIDRRWVSDVFFFACTSIRELLNNFRGIDLKT